MTNYQLLKYIIITKKKVYIVTPLRSFIEELKPIQQIYQQVADHFGCIADAVSSVTARR